MKTRVFQIYVVINVIFVTISTAQNYRIQNAIGVYGGLTQFNIDTDKIIAMHPIVKPIIDIHPVKRLGPEPLPPIINLFAIFNEKFIRTLMPLMVQFFQPSKRAIMMQECK